MIPDFQNPTGRTWSLERRKALIELARKYQILVIEDNPYGELRFEGEMLPSVKSLDTDGRVVYLGTYSKTLCPGLRVGWMVAEPYLLEKFILIKQGADLHTSTISQMHISRLLERFDYDGHIMRIRQVYRNRKDVMINAMKQFFPKEVQFNNPQGGLFTWAELPETIDTKLLLEKALERKVAFVPGSSFYPCSVKKNTMRMNFSNMPEDRIEEGVKRLAQTILTLQ